MLRYSVLVFFIVWHLCSQIDVDNNQMTTFKQTSGGFLVFAVSACSNTCLYLWWHFIPLLRFELFMCVSLITVSAAESRNLPAGLEVQVPCLPEAVSQMQGGRILPHPTGIPHAAERCVPLCLLRLLDHGWRCTDKRKRLIQSGCHCNYCCPENAVSLSKGLLAQNGSCILDWQQGDC